jgi:monoamine oxidase
VTQERHDVVVVGAGLAGLAAARHLSRAGRRVVVLEARSEVGGRTRTRKLDGVTADFGAEWIGWAHRRVRRLAAELGLTVEPARNVGRPVLWRLPSGESMGRLPPAGTWLELVKVFGRAGWAARGVKPGSAWTATRADELDRKSVAGWLGELEVSDEVRYLLERLLGSLSSSSLEGLSLLQFAWWMRLVGDPVRSLYTTFQSRLSEGTQELARRLAKQAGVEVRFEAPVSGISQNGHVLVETEGGGRHEARQAVVAVPANLVPRIEFDPPLPEAQAALGDLRIGSGTKVIALLPPGHGVRHNTVLGGEPLWGAWRRGDRITGFVPEPQADAPDEELVADLAAAFRVDPGALRHPTVFRWSDEPHVRGCDLAFAPGQVRSHGPALASAHGLIRFAGAERSSWPNNMEGALESGERAAAGVLQPAERPGTPL